MPRPMLCCSQKMTVDAVAGRIGIRSLLCDATSLVQFCSESQLL
jgi:hypothetical protein